MQKIIGAAIRRFRRGQGMTLETLAQRSGLSKGYLSKVERGLKSPPVSTLSNLAGALGVDLSDLFPREDNSSRLTLVRKADRRAASRDRSSYGYDYEALAFPRGPKLMEPFIITFTPEAKTNHRVSHEGEEMILVLEGRMLFFYGQEEIVCEEGDCLYFDSSVPHLGSCLEGERTRILMVISSGRHTTHNH